MAFLFPPRRRSITPPARAGWEASHQRGGAQRFKSEEQAGIIKGLADGRIDVVIGTHRLLSTTKFKGLGLLIVDEEQRFGVAREDQAAPGQRRRADADFAPCTWRWWGCGHVGVTNAAGGPHRGDVRREHDEALIRMRSAELSCGAVFCTTKGSRPWTRWLPACTNWCLSGLRSHTAMPEDRLELLLDFMDGEYDVLVATTIIENGSIFRR